MKQLVISLVLATACGSIKGNNPTDASRPTDADTVDGLSIDAAVVDRSCKELKTRLGITSDGPQWIDPDLDGASYTPFRVYCANMNTDTPLELLELHTTTPTSQDPPTSNYSTYGTGAPHAAWTCNCGTITMDFTKVVIDPVTLTVSAAGMPYVTYADSTDQNCLQTMAGCPGVLPYALAQSCIANSFAGGKANLDLTGMPFHVAGVGMDVSMFTMMGFTAVGTTTIDPARKIVNLTGGGDCGGNGAYSGVQLAQDL